MSFDEEPDGDPHGECAAEIARLSAENLTLRNVGVTLQAEVERLRKERDIYKAADVAMQDQSAEYKVERDDALRENEALRKDAERYRWLRDRTDCTHGLATFELDVPHPSITLDAAIDAALAARPGEKT